MYEELKELPESKEEVKIDILIKGDFCSENCPFLFINDYDFCYLFNASLYGHYITDEDDLCMYQRCKACKEKVPSK